MKKLITSLCILGATCTFAQEDLMVKTAIPSEQSYEFSTVIDIEASAVKSQGNTGTCWSFSTSSFLESEIFRKSGEFIDISEMFNVHNTYQMKAWNYVMRQGKLQFSEGGLAHDVMNSIQMHGMVPESAYSGLLSDAKNHDHSKIVPQLQTVLDAYIKNGKDSKYPDWEKATDSILDIALGDLPEVFVYNGVNYTPEKFFEMTEIVVSDYVTLTSFNHVPYNTEFVLNIPDNFSNGSFKNIRLNQLIEATDEALKNGYTLALDCDVSETTFSQKHGLAVIPKNLDENERALAYIVEEAEITEDYRQAEFENYNTTDDHLMHIVGLVKDQNGTEYYKVKNSWGTEGERIGNGGYVYMSKPFFRLKTISVMVHKDALPEKLKKDLKI